MTLQVALKKFGPLAPQVVGVFPGARMNDGTEEELDVDVELLNWEEPIFFVG